MTTFRPREARLLSNRVFADVRFQAIWALCLFVAVTRLWWLRDALLVLWIYGAEAYFDRGLRILPGKPIRFSNGQIPPVWADLITGFGFFFVVTLGLTAL